MPTYTVHQPPPREGRPVPGPENFVFVRDGFYFWAFLLPPVWMLIHRTWLVLAGYLLLTAAMAVAFALSGIPPWADGIASLLFGLLIGLEAATLRRWSLRKWSQVGYVVAEDEELAERRFFAQWFDRKPAPAAAPPSSPQTLPIVTTPLPQRIPPDVIGLFPQPGTPR
ncbi:MAG: DUF2628 domain-containing protein [Pseudolabrys sp.]